MTVNNFKLVRPHTQTLTAAVEQELRNAIMKGVYRPNSQLPAESELMKILGVSRTVVREALRVLEDDGLIIRRHGVGTFVRKHPIVHNLNFNYGTTEMIKTAGMVPGNAHIEVRTMAAEPEVADALELPIGSPVIVVERLRTADGKPVVHATEYLPPALIGDLDLGRLLGTETGSLYQVLQVNLGLSIEYGLTRILPVVASAQLAEKLQVEESSVLLYLMQTDYSPTDEPLLYACEYHLSDAFDFFVMRRGPRKIGNDSPSLLTDND
jgi:GntR family transcriptional regulator